MAWLSSSPRSRSAWAQCLHQPRLDPEPKPEPYPLLVWTLGGVGWGGPGLGLGCGSHVLSALELFSAGSALSSASAALPSPASCL